MDSVIYSWLNLSLLNTQVAINIAFTSNDLKTIQNIKQAYYRLIKQDINHSIDRSNKQATSKQTAEQSNHPNVFLLTTNVFH